MVESAGQDGGDVTYFFYPGGHRRLGPTVSRVRSFKMDKWKRCDFEVFLVVGNREVNEFFEARLPAHTKPSSESELEEKVAYV